MSVTQLDICNLALNELGVSSISAIFPDDGSDRSYTCFLHYPRLRGSLLSKYTWQFQKEKFSLNRLTAAPLTRWLYQFTLPPTRTKNAPIALFLSAEANAADFKEFEIVGTRILCNELAVWADYTTLADESIWPEYFIELMSMALAAKICMAVTGDEAQAKQLKFEAWGETMAVPGGMYAAARQADFRDTPPALVRDFTLVNAREGGVEGA